jgi:hypothetical protein
MHLEFKSHTMLSFNVSHAHSTSQQACASHSVAFHDRLCLVPSPEMGFIGLVLGFIELLLGGSKSRKGEVSSTLSLCKEKSSLSYTHLPCFSGTLFSCSDFGRMDPSVA